jgi:3-phosphoshikimate 1-carboxyvinyltransferase
VNALVTSPGGVVSGEARLPGDKSIAHRWLIMAATGDGPSSLDGLPRSLDIVSTASCLAALVPPVRPALEAWASAAPVAGDPDGSTWNRIPPNLDLEPLEVQGQGRDSLHRPPAPLMCANSGTTMRLLAGLVAGSPFETVLIGDESLSRRPMERVAEPLRRMGASVATERGHAPVTVHGSELHGVDLTLDVPSAQVKGAILLAATAARGVTTLVEPAPTRDHSERLLRALGAPLPNGGVGIRIEGPFQHGGLVSRVPGDVSSASFLIAAAALTGGRLDLTEVGLNPSRLRFLEVMRRIGLRIEISVEGDALGEPVGRITVLPATRLRAVTVSGDELPLVIDEVPVLAALAAHAEGESRFEGAGELRVKESDRLAAMATGLRALGGVASEEGEGLTVGGGGLPGGSADAAGDHRVAMALSVSALAADAPCRIRGIGSAAVSFPGFAGVLAGLGASVEGEP